MASWSRLSNSSFHFCLPSVQSDGTRLYFHDSNIQADLQCWWTIPRTGKCPINGQYRLQLNPSVLQGPSTHSNFDRHSLQFRDNPIHQHPTCHIHTVCNHLCRTESTVFHIRPVCNLERPDWGQCTKIRPHSQHQIYWRIIGICSSQCCSHSLPDCHLRDPEQ